jgi:mRNA-degrading endonuclease YafQ of YafQ-DinJ toxin-antitoxin module
MIISEIILKPYTFEELTTFSITESAGDWQVSQSSAFKKGLKKYSKDSRVMEAFNELMNFIKDHPAVPPVREYPAQLNVHQITKHDRFSGTMWAHLKGQKIGILFSVDPGVIKLIHLGTHQELGWR